MSRAEQFYRRRHRHEPDYAACVYDLKALFRHRTFGQWADVHRGKSPRLLDVGVGKGLFLRGVAAELERRWQAAPAVSALDVVRSPGNVFDGLDWDFRLHDVDGQDLPYADDAFDFVSCNHVLEHVFETEHLLRELRRIAAPDSLCVLSTPNIAAWINRVTFFLWGNQPLGSELGTESITYGFRPRVLQRRLAVFRPSGHIRDFTPRGLQDLCEACGFETLGWWKQDRGPLARVHRWASRNMAILLAPIAPRSPAIHPSVDVPRSGPRARSAARRAR